MVLKLPTDIAKNALNHYVVNPTLTTLKALIPYGLIPTPPTLNVLSPTLPTLNV